MRYIPDLAANVIVQVPEDKNSYINIRNLGASGRGDVKFSGTISDIQDDLVTISGVTDGSDGSLSQYRDTLKSFTDLIVFGYDLATTPEPSVLSVSSHTSVSVDFSTSTATNPNLAPLKYIVFGFDPVTGRLPNFRSVVEIGTKVLNPDLWNTSQYVQLNFSRSSQYALPVVYRIWGNRVDFLGVIGNNKVGYPGSGSTVFRDLGITELPSWDTDPSLPWFMSDVFSVSGSDVTMVRRVTGKQKVKIQPDSFGSQPNYIQCEMGSINTSFVAGGTARFIIDDTQHLQNAIGLAATTSVKDVFIPSGIYNISDIYFLNSTQRDYSGITLRGTGSASIIKRLPCTLSNPSYPGLINFTGQSVSPRVSGLKLRTLTLDGNRSESYSLVSPVSTEIGLRVQYADNVVVDECIVVNCGGGGIGLYNTNGVTFTSNTIRTTGRAYEQSVSPLIIDTSENVVAQGNLMEFATTGPKVISTSYSAINANIVRSCGDSGIILESSSQWNVQSNNVAYSDNDSIIRSIDTYNNEYSKASIEVRSGVALDPIFMTVTYGGESIGIVKNSIVADIFPLNSLGVKTTPASGAFRVLETSAQLEAGIFSLTLPGTTSTTFSGKTIPATNTLTSTNGYMYEVKATVKIGQGGRGFIPLSIRSKIIDSTSYLAIALRNSSDLLGLQIYSASSPENDRIQISGFSNTGLSSWDQNASYSIVGIDTDTNSILLNSIPGLSLSTTVPVEFTGSPRLFILRSNYFVADGNLIVHTF
jgi:parallel beta-helix repeat protein